jgi:hypothetical protein
VRMLRTLDDFTEGYFRDHPEEVDDYLMETEVAACEYVSLMRRSPPLRLYWREAIAHRFVERLSLKQSLKSLPADA